MTEKFGLFNNRTYKLLRGLSKSDPDKPPAPSEIDQLQVPERKNRAILPKYGQTIRTHCPKGGEILKKKITKFGILWLEYEEEDLDDEDSGTANDTAKSEFVTEVRDKICKYPKLYTSVEHEYMDAENTLKHGNLTWHTFSFEHYASPRNLILENIGNFVKSVFANDEVKNWKYLIQDYRGDEIYGEKELFDIEAELYRTLNGLLEIVSTDTGVSVIDKGEHGDKARSVYCLVKEYDDNMCTELGVAAIANEDKATLYLKDSATSENIGQHTLDATSTLEDYIYTDAIEDHSLIATDSEVEAEAASLCCNDKLDGDSNATDIDVERFSDLISETEDDIFNNDGNVTTDTINEQVQTSQVGEIDESEDEGEFMYGILGVYSRG